MLEIPSVEVIKSIQPANQGTGEADLVYSALSNRALTYRKTSGTRWNKFSDATPRSLNEVSKARQVALESLVLTSEILNQQTDTDQYNTWADRFTTGSIELYGQPEKYEALNLVALSLNDLDKQRRSCDQLSIPYIEFLQSIYSKLLQGTIFEDRDLYWDKLDRYKADIELYGRAVRERYQPIFDIVELSEKKEYSASEIRIVFEKAIDWLKENDEPSWSQWKIINSNRKALMVSSINREIDIPDGRKNATANELVSLLAHELLVHAQRANNGYLRVETTGTKKLAIGLPRYDEAEEGLAVITDQAISGKRPNKMVERYMDIALALGILDGQQRTRQEMYDICFARRVINSFGSNRLTQPDINKLEKDSWKYVDRIYRGGRGNLKDRRQAIFTRDAVYYAGYLKMRSYISKQITEGKSTSQILDYLSQGKFDPTNEDHKYFVLLN